MLGFHQRAQGGEERRPHASLGALPTVKRGSTGSTGARASSQGATGDIPAPTAPQGTPCCSLRHVALVDEPLAAATPLCHSPLTTHGTYALQCPCQDTGWSPGQVWKDSPHDVLSKILPSIPAAVS